LTHVARRESSGTMYFPLRRPQGELSDSELYENAGIVRHRHRHRHQ
jgi:hypothetical protein